MLYRYGLRQLQLQENCARSKPSTLSMQGGFASPIWPTGNGGAQSNGREWRLRDLFNFGTQVPNWNKTAISMVRIVSRHAPPCCRVFSPCRTAFPEQEACSRSRPGSAHGYIAKLHGLQRFRASRRSLLFGCFGNGGSAAECRRTARGRRRLRQACSCIRSRFPHLPSRGRSRGCHRQSRFHVGQRRRWPGPHGFRAWLHGVRKAFPGRLGGGKCFPDGGRRQRSLLRCNRRCRGCRGTAPRSFGQRVIELVVGSSEARAHDGWRPGRQAIQACQCLRTHGPHCRRIGFFEKAKTDRDRHQHDQQPQPKQNRPVAPAAICRTLPFAMGRRRPIVGMLAVAGIRPYRQPGPKLRRFNPIAHPVSGPRIDAGRQFLARNHRRHGSGPGTLEVVYMPVRTALRRLLPVI
jgi:hypothetical protein